MATKTRLSRKKLFFNKINLTKDDDVYIGIDAHKDSYNIVVWLNDAPAIDYTMPANSKKLIKDIEKIKPAIKNIVYEAGYFGLVIYVKIKLKNVIITLDGWPHSCLQVLTWGLSFRPHCHSEQSEAE